MRRRFLVRGRVQGVGFRQFVAARARALRLAGFVRNLPDGSVEVAAEGPKSAVRRLEEICREGPALSRVDSLDVLEEPCQRTLGFDILR